MSDLRTRIITALLSEDDVALMADAVIRELNLEVNISYPTSVGSEVCVKGHYTKWVGNA